MTLTMYYKIISIRSNNTYRQKCLSVEINIQISENSLMEWNDSLNIY